jgi:hypothetical protein
LRPKKNYDSDTVYGMFPGCRDYVSLVKADGTQEKVHKKILLMMMMMEAIKMFSWS